MLPEVAADPEDKDNRQSKVGLEEVIGLAVLTGATNWPDGSVELQGSLAFDTHRS